MKFYPKFFITLGSAGNSSFYIKDLNGDWQEFSDYNYFKIAKRQNQVSEFEIDMWDLEAAEKLYVKEFAEVLFFSENNLILKGRIQKITYRTAYEVSINGFGMESKLLEKELIKNGDKRVQYTNESAQTIAKEILSSDTSGSSPWIITPNTNGLFDTDYGNISMRYEYGNRLNSLGKLTEAIEHEWGVSQGDSYNDDFFNIAPLLPNTTRATVSQETFNITGENANCYLTQKETDITNVANKIDCYDDKTEVLTKDGFKLFKNVTYEDKIATLNPDTDELEYHNPTDMQVAKHKGKMLKFDSKQINLLVTENHNLYTKKINNKKGFYLTKPKDHFGQWLKMKKDCNWSGKKQEYFTIPKMINEWTTEDNSRGFRKRKKIYKWDEKKIPMDLWVKFMGWYLSEGSLSSEKSSEKSGYKIDIRQIKEPNRTEIYELIEEMGFNAFLCKGRVSFYHKPLWTYLKQFGHAEEKYVPQDIKDLDSKLIDKFLNTLFLGDGHFDKTSKKMQGYSSTSKKLRDDVAELLLKTGKSCKVSERQRDMCLNDKTYGCRKIYELSVNHSFLTPQIKPSQMTKIDYDGMIYDLTVPNHILFVRREGVSCWSGNCLGYGDGVNQKHTSTYNASETYSILATEITAISTTISLVDASSFPSSGEIRIAEERIIYTGKSGNDLTGCDRGANSTTPLAHKKNVYTEKYVDIDSAESGSSIGTNGLMDYTITERDIIDIETLELIASRKLLERMNPIVRIRVTPNEPLDTAGNRQIGDLITINDAESDIVDDYRIVGINYISNYGDLELEIEASNKSLSFIEQMQKQKEQNENLSKYMQGATNIYAINEAENCDSSHYLDMRFYLPEDIVAINSIKLNFKLKDYRAYSTGVSGAPVSQTNTSMWHSSAIASITKLSGVGYANGMVYGLGTTSGIVTGTSLNQTPDYDWELPRSVSNAYWVKSSDTTPDAWSDLSTTYSGVLTDYYSISSKRFLLGESFGYTTAYTSSSTRNDIIKASSYNTTTWPANVFTQCKAENLSGTFDKIRTSFSIQNGTGATAYPTITLSRSPDGSSWTTVQTYTPTLTSSQIYQQQIEESTDYRDYIYKVNITNMNVNNDFDKSWIILNVGTYIKSTNELNYGIKTETLTSPSVDLYIGEDDGTMTKKDTYTTNQTELDITSEVSEIGEGKWVNVQFRPNKNMRIEANAYVKIFIESK